MIDAIANHIKEALPAWILGIVAAGCGVAFTVIVAWYNIDRDLSLVKCKLGIEVNALCAWTSTIVEDIAKETSETD